MMVIVAQDERVMSQYGIQSGQAIHAQIQHRKVFVDLLSQDSEPPESQQEPLKETTGKLDPLDDTKEWNQSASQLAEPSDPPMYPTGDASMPMSQTKEPGYTSELVKASGIHLLAARAAKAVLELEYRDTNRLVSYVGCVGSDEVAKLLLHDAEQDARLCCEMEALPEGQ